MNIVLKTLAVLLSLTSPSLAHHVWIDQPEGEAAMLRFGEFGENLRETSPGLLDRFGKPTATLLSAKGERAGDLVKSASGFTLPFKVERGEAIVAEDAAYPLRTSKQGERDVTSWYRPAARYVTDLAAQAPRLTLDIVPAGQPGAFKVFFKGQPLNKAKVSVIVQSGWTKEARTDEQGLASVDLPWKGSYVLQVIHPDRNPGERAGANGPEKYDTANYVTTLHVTQSDGLVAIPAGPAAAPNK